MFTVLVIENSCHHNSISHIIRKHFSCSCQVHTASSSRDVFHFISKTNANIILMDMDIPGLNSHDLFHLFQRDHHCQILLPVIDLNFFDHTLFDNAPSVPDYLLKPFSESELVLTIEEALQCCIMQGSSLPDSKPAEQPEVSRTDIFKIRLQQYISSHYRDIFSMQEVAHSMNYSDTHFCRLFKQCFHVNFSAYLNNFRVEQAKRLLEDSDLAVKEVSTACGYRDTSYFIRVFKRHTGTTPSEYRIQKLSMTARKSDKSQKSFIS